jgi:glycosyltransferase involved in cell wall biosynthesis
MRISSSPKDGQATSSEIDHPQSINVLHIICSLPLGGAESQVVTLASALASDRYKIQVCCLKQEGVQASSLRSKGIPVVSLNMRLRYWPIAVYRLYRLLKQLKPKIVHTHMYEAGIWGGMAGKLAGVPVIIATEHSITFTRERHVFIEFLINHFANQRTAVSEEIRRCYIENHLGSPENIINIPNAVEVGRFDRLDSRNQLRTQFGAKPLTALVGSVARLVQPKRLDYLLQAARIVCDAIPQTCFLIVGDGPLRQELERQARHLDLGPEHVMFLGSRQDVPDLLAAIDIFVLSSEAEGLPVAMLEAMAASKPVIVTQVGAIPQIIQDGFNGLLVSPHDPIGLANAILMLIGDSFLREALAREAYRTVNERFSIEVVGQQMIALYDNLLEKKGGYRVI